MIKRHIKTSAAVLAAGALFAVGGMGTATAARLITGDRIANNTITADNLAANSVGKSELQNGIVKDGKDGVDGVDGVDGDSGAEGARGLPGVAGPAGPVGPAGTPGAQGSQGQQGPRGSDGAPGLSGVRADEPYTTTIAAHSVGVAFTACPAGKTALGGGFRLNGFAAEAFQGGGSAVDVTAIASEPVGVINNQIVNTWQNAAFPQDETGRFLPNAWAVTVQNNSNNAQDVRVAVVCANVAS